MSMLEHAMTWLSTGLAEHLSVPVDYVKASGEIVSMPAVPGRTVFRAENEYGLTIRTETRDFLISSADMPEAPQRGEHIVFNGKTYEILAPNGEPCWRWSDAFRTTRRIHAKETNGQQ